jgi:manganese-dependent inorganic pyrophosphatase
VTKRDQVLVAGHQRPDTDAVVAAVVLARLRRKRDRRRHYLAIMQGEANRQTRWLFQQTRIKLPPIRHDIRWTVGETMHGEEQGIISLSPEARLGDAMEILQRQRISMVPVVDRDRRLLGVISPRLPQNQYFFNFNVEDYLGHLLSLEDVVLTFGLQTLKSARIEPAAAMPGSFRVAGGGTLNIDGGDVVMAVASANVIREVERAGAQAIIIADATRADAERAAKASRHLPVYFYAGSLLALLSSLSLCIPLRTIMTAEVVRLKSDQRLDQALPALQDSLHALPVVDEEDRLIGVLSHHQALSPKRRSLILVDHFERTQTVKGVDAAKIEEIVDHHRVGGIETLMPARVDCRPVGSSATIVALQFEEAGLIPTADEATLLLGALISDTLLLTSPTTTAIDRALAPKLAKVAGVKLKSFGRELLRQNDELADGDAEKLVQKDVKAFTRGELNFGVAQLETVDLSTLNHERARELRQALDRFRLKSGWGMAALAVTDVLKGDSRMLIIDQEPERERHLAAGSTNEQGEVWAGMVSRKKQILPLLCERLDSYIG